MKSGTLFVTVSEDSEWNATDAGLFSSDTPASFSGTEFNDDGTMTAEYDVEYYEADDIQRIKSKLNEDDEVIKYRFVK